MPLELLWTHFVRIPGANFPGHRDGALERIRADSRVRASCNQRRDDRFRRDVAHQIVTREWAAAHSCKSAIESPASRIVGRQNLCCGSLGPAVEMNAQLNAADAVSYRGIERASLLGCCVANRIGQ